ncbi:MAG: hypothetical protein IPK72_02990 [Candidatus Eisenbacteria bacterium]|nr:hypothetical protein [Candidatus Eisenbacteria bacterium]
MRKLIGYGLVLLVSIVLGYLAGQQFYRLFLSIVPQAVLTPLMNATMHASCIGYGIAIGAVMFLWVAVGGVILKIFNLGSGKKASATVPANRPPV